MSARLSLFFIGSFLLSSFAIIKILKKGGISDGRLSQLGGVGIWFSFLIVRLPCP